MTRMIAVAQRVQFRPRNNYGTSLYRYGSLVGPTVRFHACFSECLDCRDFWSLDFRTVYSFAVVALQQVENNGLGQVYGGTVQGGCLRTEAWSLQFRVLHSSLKVGMKARDRNRFVL